LKNRVGQKLGKKVWEKHHLTTKRKMPQRRKKGGFGCGPTSRIGMRSEGRRGHQDGKKRKGLGKKKPHRDKTDAVANLKEAQHREYPGGGGGRKRKRRPSPASSRTVSLSGADLGKRPP